MITALKTFCALVIFLSLLANAAFLCGSWKLTGNDDGWVRVNGEKVASQEVKELGVKGDGANTVWNTGLMLARDGNNYGFELVKCKGKAFPNAQLLQNSMDAPRIIGSFPCKKVLD